MQRRDFTKQLLWGAPVATQFLHSPKGVSLARKTILPRRLRKGDTIGLIAPGSPVTAAKLETAVRNFEKLGLHVKYNEATILAQKGFLAGEDTQRLADLHAMFADTSVQAVWCIRGGYGTARLLPQLDFKLIKNNPKIFVGYSDITALHTAIHQQTGLVTFHGPMGISEFSAYTTEQAVATLMGDTTAYTIVQATATDTVPPHYIPTVLRAGRATGCLLGGNLSLLAAMAGTPYTLRGKNSILCIEEVDERPYRIDRMLTQLLQAGTLQGVRGIVLGIFEGCQPKEGEPSLSLLETLQDRLLPLQIPVLYGFSFGHVTDMCTLPIGAKVTMDTERFSLSLPSAVTLA